MVVDAGESFSSSSSPPPPRIVDSKSKVSYHKGRLLGKGGFAEVYEVRELTTNKVYADKMIRKEKFARRKSSKKKVEREIALHRGLYHPNVVRFFWYFTDERSVHIILEKCGLESLYHVVRLRETLTEPEVRYYVKQICEGVRYIHGRGIIHRDLKLGNMFLTDDMVIKIGDFGLATKVGKGEEEEDLRKKATLCGTPNYIAPEVLAKLGHNMTADIWAVGCMTYAMLFGSPPFETESLKKTYAKIAANEYSIPGDSVSIHTRSFIKKLLHPEPEQRGVLRRPGHPQDLFRHSFFKQGFLPSRLSKSVVTAAPKFSDEALRRKTASTPPPPSDSVITSCVPANLRNKISSVFSQHGSSISSADSSSSSLKGGASSSSSFSLSSSSSPPPFVAHVIGILRRSLRNVSSLSEESPSPIEFIPTFVSKWIDYSNKYGFGYQMSDGGVAALLNDYTYISFLIEDGKKLYGYSDGNRSFTIESGDRRLLSPDLSSRVKLIKYFFQFMEEKLADGKPSKSATQVTVTTECLTLVPKILCWARTPRSLILVLNNSSIQINLFKERVRIVLWKCNAEFYVTFLKSEMIPVTYSLNCSWNKASSVRTPAWQRLNYALNILEDFYHKTESPVNESSS